MLKSIYKNSEKGRATARVAPTEGLQGVRKNGRGRTPPLRRGYKGRGRTGGVEPRPYGWVASSAAEWATARVAPTGCNMGCGERADVGIGPYGGVTRSAVNKPPGICRRGPPFGFLGKKIPASKAGSILPYYGGGDNARKNFAGGEILSHTMIFF